MKQKLLIAALLCVSIVAIAAGILIASLSASDSIKIFGYVLYIIGAFLTDTSFIIIFIAYNINMSVKKAIVLCLLFSICGCGLIVAGALLLVSGVTGFLAVAGHIIVILGIVLLIFGVFLYSYYFWMQH